MITCNHNDSIQPPTVLHNNDYKKVAINMKEILHGQTKNLNEEAIDDIAQIQNVST